METSAAISFSGLLKSGAFRKNHLTECTPYEGCAFEIFGADEAFVRREAAEYPQRVATIVLDPADRMVLVRGFITADRFLHFVAREDLPNFRLLFIDEEVCSA